MNKGRTKEGRCSTAPLAEQRNGSVGYSHHFRLAHASYTNMIGLASMAATRSLNFRSSPPAAAPSAGADQGPAAAPRSEAPACLDCGRLVDEATTSIGVVAQRHIGAGAGLDRGADPCLHQPGRTRAARNREARPRHTCIANQQVVAVIGSVIALAHMVWERIFRG